MDPLWNALRQERNRRLLESDWTILEDSPLSVAEKTEATTYRQTLRDLPINTVDPEWPEFPTKPYFLE